jgi:outer membrane murein-binding lipoprotein Lpp
MAEFAPMRTGRLVVRYHAPWRRRTVMTAAAVGALLLFYGAYEWGRFEGGYSKFAEIQRRRELSAKIEALEEEKEKLRSDAAAAELARSVDRKAYANVEKSLADLQAQVLRHREELTFYRGIVSPEDGIGGLRIQRFQILPGSADRHYRLLLVLVQSMGQDKVVSGTAIIQIEGARENRPVQLSLTEVKGSSRADGQLPFQFRHFQNLEQDIVLPEGFEPKAVNVEVRSARLQAVRESYPWQVQTEG